MNFEQKIHTLGNLGYITSFGEFEDYIEITDRLNKYALRLSSGEFEHMDVRYILDLFRRHHQGEPSYINPGPTNTDLQNPAIKNAWDEFQIILKLSRGNY